LDFSLKVPQPKSFEARAKSDAPVLNGTGPALNGTGPALNGTAPVLNGTGYPQRK
jgi:hypothetical protein